MGDEKQKALNVGLFVTCLVDLFRPGVGFAALALLERAGCHVDVPAMQTCCGQPAYNAGDNTTAAKIAADVIDTFDSFDYVVVPSGSCAGMLVHHYPDLFDANSVYREKAQKLAGRTHELVSFLHDILAVSDFDARYDATVTYHDSCSGLREMNIEEQPRRLLAGVAGLNLKEMTDTHVCCGFGGTFCVKYADISTRLVSDKVANIEASGADTLLGGDLGCLLNIAGRLRRSGSQVKVFHVAEVLSAMTDVGPIGAPLNK